MVIMYNRISYGAKECFKEIITYFAWEIVLNTFPAKQKPPHRQLTRMKEQEVMTQMKGRDKVIAL